MRSSRTGCERFVARSVSLSGRRESSRRSEPTCRCGWSELDPPPTGDFILLGMDHISVPVTDVARTKAFYMAILLRLGWRCSVWRADGYVFFKNNCSPVL